jgi:hypothetical protein
MRSASLLGFLVRGPLLRVALLNIAFPLLFRVAEGTARTNSTYDLTYDLSYHCRPKLRAYQKNIHNANLPYSQMSSSILCTL